MEADLIRLGLVCYDDALRMQRQLVEARLGDRIPNQVLLLHHPHVYTMGRRAAPENILAGPAELEQHGVRVFRSDRGGNVTYHGPGQIVLYPILALPRPWRNVARYVAALEEAMIRTLDHFGIRATRDPGLPGVWVGRDKIGAIGVHLSRWVTSHGLALNVDPDLEMFKRIVPCGIHDRGVTSMARLLDTVPDIRVVEDTLIQQVAALFDLTWNPRTFDLETIQVFVHRRRPSLEFLAMHRRGASPFWQPVTGKLEPGETPAQAAAREVREETGLQGKLIDLDFVYGFALDPETVTVPGCPFPCYVREHSFALEVPEKAEVHLETRTHDAIRWLRPEDAETVYRWPGNREGCRRAARRLAAVEQSS